MPGRYIKPGYVFTSRGCPRRCWFCSVWKRDPVPRLLPIVDGWNILDDNLLACPRDHVEAVFAMLRRQNRRIEFTGGLEALALQDYQVELLASLRPRPTMFFAYDPGDEFETLRSAAGRLLEAGFTAASHLMRVYVLIGFPKDTFAPGRAALAADAAIGFTPQAMLWRPETPSQMKYAPEESWKRLQRLWARPGIIHAREAIPYGRSPGRRARVMAARAANGTTPAIAPICGQPTSTSTVTCTSTGAPTSAMYTSDRLAIPAPPSCAVCARIAPIFMPASWPVNSRRTPV